MFAACIVKRLRIGRYALGRLVRRLAARRRRRAGTVRRLAAVRRPRGPLEKNGKKLRAFAARCPYCRFEPRWPMLAEVDSRPVVVQCDRCGEIALDAPGGCRPPTDEELRAILGGPLGPRIEARRREIRIDRRPAFSVGLVWLFITPASQAEPLSIKNVIVSVDSFTCSNPKPKPRRVL